MKRSCLFLLLALSGLAACAEPAAITTASVSPRFQLVAVETLAVGAEPPGGIATPEPVYGPAVLTVRIDGLLPSLRRVLATVDEIEQVVVTVRMADGSGVEMQKTVDRAALQAGQNMVIFKGLPEGMASVVIEAFDASQQMLGKRLFTRSLSAPATFLDVALVQVVVAQSASGGSSGGGTAPPATATPAPSPSAQGELVADISLADSPVIDGVAPGTVLKSIGGFEALGSVQVTASGELWALAKEATGYSAVRFAADGSVAQKVAGGDAAGIDGNGFGVDSRGHLWMIEGARKKLSHYNASGSLVGSVALTSGASLVIDTADQVWVTDYRDLVQISPLGQLVARHALGGSSGTVVLDPGTGALYVPVQPSTPSELVKLLPAGTVEWRQVQTGWRDVFVQSAIDGAGHLWVPLYYRREVIRLAPDGSVVARHALPTSPRRVWVGPDGALWVGTDASLIKLSAAGEVLGEFRGAGGPVSVAFDAQGQLWAAHGGTLSQMAP